MFRKSIEQLYNLNKKSERWSFVRILIKDTYFRLAICVPRVDKCSLIQLRDCECVKISIDKAKSCDMAWTDNILQY